MSNNIHNVNMVETGTGYKQELKRTLTFKSLIIFGIAYMTLTTVMTYNGPVGQMTHGMVAMCYLIATVAILFTAISYAHMVKVYPVAGSAYTYASNTLNQHVGFMTGWVMILDYTLLSMFSCVLLGLYMNVIIPSVPAWVWVIIGCILLCMVQIVGVDVMSKVNSVLVIISAIFIVAFFIMMIRFIVEGSGIAGLFDIKGLINMDEMDEVGWGTLFTGASIVIISFLGCDAVTTLAEETIEPEKNIGKAIIVIVIGIGSYFVIYSYLMQLSWPEGWMMFENPDTAGEEVVRYVAGATMGYIFSGIFVVTCATCALSSQASATRLLYGMGRDGVIPKKFFGYINPKFKTPVKNILLMCALTIIIGCTVDFMSLASVINFGALLGFAIVNLCVIVHYVIKEKRRGPLDILKYVISPLIGGGVCLAIWLSLDRTALIIGGIWVVLGLIALGITTKGFKEPPKKISFDE